MGVERGFAPSQGQGTASLVGFGATPHLFLVKPIQREKSSKVAAAKRPAPKLRASSDAPPICSFQRLCCVAQMARPNCLSFRHGCLFLFVAGISRLRARVGGFAVAPDAPSHCTSMFLDFSRCRGNRACGRDKEAFRSPLDPFGSHCRSWFLSLQGELHPQHRSENHYRDSKRLSPLTSPSPSPSA